MKKYDAVLKLRHSQSYNRNEALVKYKLNLKTNHPFFNFSLDWIKNSDLTRRYQTCLRIFLSDWAPQGLLIKYYRSRLQTDTGYTRYKFKCMYTRDYSCIINT